MRLLELKVPPLLLTAVFAALIFGARAAWPRAVLPLPGHRVAAAVLGGAGLALLLGAALQFRRARTTLDPRDPARATRFVAAGLYRFTRNPMYLGMALVLLGAAAWTAQAVALLLVAVFVAWLTAWQIRPEERALAERFGASYTDYTRRVRRWL